MFFFYIKSYETNKNIFLSLNLSEDRHDLGACLLFHCLFYVCVDSKKPFLDTILVRVSMCVLCPRVDSK